MATYEMKVTLTHTITVNDVNYDPNTEDYPLTEQIADEIINGLAEGDDYWDLSDGECEVEIIKENG